MANAASGNIPLIIELKAEPIFPPASSGGIDLNAYEEMQDREEEQMLRLLTSLRGVARARNNYWN